MATTSWDENMNNKDLPITEATEENVTPSEPPELGATQAQIDMSISNTTVTAPQQSPAAISYDVLLYPKPEAHAKLVGIPKQNTPRIPAPENELLQQFLNPFLEAMAICYQVLLKKARAHRTPQAMATRKSIKYTFETAIHKDELAMGDIQRGRSPERSKYTVSFTPNEFSFLQSCANVFKDNDMVPLERSDFQDMNIEALEEAAHASKAAYKQLDFRLHDDLTRICGLRTTQFEGHDSLTLEYGRVIRKALAVGRFSTKAHELATLKATKNPELLTMMNERFLRLRRVQVLSNQENQLYSQGTQLEDQAPQTCFMGMTKTIPFIPAGATGLGSSPQFQAESSSTLRVKRKGPSDIDYDLEIEYSDHARSFVPPAATKRAKRVPSNHDYSSTGFHSTIASFVSANTTTSSAIQTVTTYDPDPTNEIDDPFSLNDQLHDSQASIAIQSPTGPALFNNWDDYLTDEALALFNEENDTPASIEDNLENFDLFNNQPRNDEKDTLIGDSESKKNLESTNNNRPLEEVVRESKSNLPLIAVEAQRKASAVTESHNLSLSPSSPKADVILEDKIYSAGVPTEIVSNNRIFGFDFHYSLDSFTDPLLSFDMPEILIADGREESEHVEADPSTIPLSGFLKNLSPSCEKPELEEDFQVVEDEGETSRYLLVTDQKKLSTVEDFTFDKEDPALISNGCRPDCSDMSLTFDSDHEPKSTCDSETHIAPQDQLQVSEPCFSASNTYPQQMTHILYGTGSRTTLSGFERYNDLDADPTFGFSMPEFEL